jgi:carbon monoxide dehydrogenase subunit G
MLEFLVPTVDIVDETYVAVPPAELAPGLTDPATLAAWFPDLRFDVFMDRGEKGTRWSIRGDLDGSMEVWLEGMARGTLVHWFVRGEPRPGLRKAAQRYVDVLNARMFAFKDAAERDAADRERSDP